MLERRASPVTDRRKLSMKEKKQSERRMKQKKGKMKRTGMRWEVCGVKSKREMKMRASSLPSEEDDV